MQTFRSMATAAVLAAAALTASITAPASAALAQSGQTQNPFTATQHPVSHPAAQPAPDLTSVWCSGTRFCLTVGAGPVSAVWNGKSWRFVKMPATRAQTLQLGCVSRTNCMATGAPGNGSHAVIDRWNGSSWRPLHPPAASADSVACAARNRCVTVGGRNGALAWNGKSWRKVTMSKPAGVTSFELTSVSCASSANCVAVGSFAKNHSQHGMAVAWNGARWRLLPAPPAIVTAVSCPKPGRCVAVGARLSLTWNGRSWHKVLINGIPGFVAIDHISCPSFSFCVAVAGGVSTAVAWNGTSWKVLPDTKIDDNEGIWCTSPANCMTVGNQASRWNGRTWTTVRLTKVDQLKAISCASSGDCVAFGLSNAARFGDTTMAESWDGTSWRVLPVPLEPIQQISCTSATFCLAVKDSDPPGIESWNGSKWSALPSPSQQSDVQALSCSSASNCVVIGSTKASIWNGASWQTTSTEPNGENTFIDAVSCATTTMCMAIGVEESSSCHHDCTASLLAEQWNGSSWSVSFDSPDPEAGQVTDQVSCPTATFCMENTGTGTMSWDGSSWHEQTADVPEFAANGLSCGSTTSCVLVEDVENTETGAVSFGAQVWDGTSWKASDLAGHISRLAGVSCSSATNCLAVGRDVSGLSLAQSWNGTTWKLLSPINP